MKNLQVAILLLLCTLGFGQEIQLDRFVNPSSSFEPVVATIGGVAQVAMGQPFPPLLRLVTMAVGAGGDKTRLYTHLGGFPTPADMVAVSSTDIVITGSVSIEGDSRLFVTRINTVTDTPVWTFVEAQRTQTTKGLQLLDTGISIVVAAELQDGFGAIGFNPATGAEQWRSVERSTVRRARIGRDASDNIYIIGSKSRSNGGTDMFVRSVTVAGELRWLRLVASFSEGFDVVSLTDPIVVGGVTPTLSDGRQPAAGLFSLRVSDGFVVSGGAFAPGREIRSPVLVRSQDRFFLSVSLENQTFFPDRELHVFSLDLAQRFVLTRPPGDAVVGISRGDRAYFLSRVSGLLTEFSREPDGLATNYVSPVVRTPKHFAFDGLDRVITVGNDGFGGVMIRRDLVRPIAVDDQFEARVGENLTINDPGVRGNDITARGATLTLLTQPSGGTVTLNIGGGFTYSSTNQDHGPDAFTYRLTAGSLTSIGTVSIIRQPNATGIELSSNRVKGGTAVTARVIMSGPRSLTPQTIPVAENSTATALSTTSVRVLPGESFSEPFTVFTARVREPVRAAITADDGNFSVEVGFLDIDPPFLTSLEAVRTTVVGGAPAQFRIVLDAPAPSNGMPISVVDNSPAILVPAVAVVPAGQTAGTFSAPTASVTSSRTAVVTASSNGITRNATVAIVGVSMTINPLSVVGGQPTTGTVTLTSNALVNSVVFDVSDNSSATAPQTPAIVPAGFRFGNFNILTAPVTSTRSSTISAANGGVVRSVTMTVRVAALQSINVSPSQLQGGNPFAGELTLDGNAAGSGATVTLASANSLVQVPASQLIPAGSQRALFVGSTTRPTQTLMIVITASLNGITRATTIIVTP